MPAGGSRKAVSVRILRQGLDRPIRRDRKAVPMHEAPEMMARVSNRLMIVDGWRSQRRLIPFQVALPILSCMFLRRDMAVL